MSQILHPEFLSDRFKALLPERDDAPVNGSEANMLARLQINERWTMIQCASFLLNNKNI
jgi:hypothetical protein